MITNNELLMHPEYIITRMRCEIFSALKAYMSIHKDDGACAIQIAETSGVSLRKVKDALNCDFNGTLDEMVRLLVAVGAYPKLEFGLY